MSITLAEAVADFFQIAVVNGKTQSPLRLGKLAEFCVQELGEMGLAGAASEVPVRGVGRTKNWDIGWPASGKTRLAISLKSILKNLPGTVPNRVDDLMGEASNVQLLSPEIVVGYLMILNVGEANGQVWSQHLDDALKGLTGRSSPAWGSGMIEDYCIVQVDFTGSTPRVLTPESDVVRFLSNLVGQVNARSW